MYKKRLFRNGRAFFFAQADGQTCSSLAGNRKLDEKPKVCGVSDFIYIEHNVYTILILEVHDFEAARLPNSTGFSRNMMKGCFAE